MIGVDCSSANSPPMRLQQRGERNRFALARSIVSLRASAATRSTSWPRPRRLAADRRQVALAAGLADAPLRERLRVQAQHRERRAQLVRDVRDQVAARIGQLERAAPLPQTAPIPPRVRARRRSAALRAGSRAGRPTA
jgi:hypothetical protein